jgi:type VI secretion system secreted protein VgrG
MSDEHRLLELHEKGPFTKDDVIISFSGREQISRPFEFYVEIMAKETKLTPDKIIGVPISVRLDRGEQDPRFFHGYVSHISIGEETEGKQNDAKVRYRTYRLRVVPWLWFLSRAARCYVFLPEKETKTVEDILTKAVERVKEFGHVKADYQDDTLGHLGLYSLEHCVQFRETDFNFLSRMLEQYGVAYYFEHSASGHKMRWARPDKFEKAKEFEVDLPQTAGGSTVNAKKDHLTSWEHHYEFVSGKYTLSDYNFKEAYEDYKTEWSKSGEEISIKNNAKYELYDYPGEYDKKVSGTDHAHDRFREEQQRFNNVSGSSTCKTFSAGLRFKLTKHHSSTDEEGKEYLITSISHSASQPPPLSSGGSDAHYSNHFEAQAKPNEYVPPRLTPKPLVSGIQTATVAGATEDEIHVDEFGRIKVHYHWDREGRGKRFSEGNKLFSWVRVAMPMAGKSWGMMAIPRVGQEVVVDFIDGDPDCPLIIGSVYNSKQPPHYPLPAEKTKSYIKTNSSKGGEGYNELMFDDKADDEKLFMHAQKNMDVHVLNDSKEHIHNDRHEIIGTEKTKSDAGDLNQLVWRDKNLTIKRDQAEHIGGNFQLLVGKGDDGEGGRVDIFVEKQEVKQVGSDGVHLTVDGPSNQKIGGGYSTDVGGDIHLKAGGDILVAAGSAGEVHIKAMTITLEAQKQMSFKVGGNFIDIGPAGISIQGVMLKLNSGGAPAAPKPCKPEAPEAIAEAAPLKPETAWISKTGSKSRPE